MVERIALIDIGSIAYGPELERRPVLTELERLSQVLRATPEQDPTLEIAYVIPGSLGRADFDGFKIGRRAGATRKVIVYVEVPEVVAESEDPLSALLDLAGAAIRFTIKAPGSREGQQSRSDADRLEAELHRAAAVLGVNIQPSPRESAGHRTRSSEALEGSDVGAAIEVVLVTPDDEAIRSAFDLEDALAAHLHTESIGSVDGNEAGQGVVTIFTIGPELEPLQRAVENLVRERWARPGASMRLRGPNDVDQVLSL